MEEVYTALKKKLAGEVTRDLDARTEVSRDASIYELVPELVISPKDSKDLKTIVSYVSKNKHAYPSLAITPRSAGTCMSGGPLGSSIVLNMTKHFNEIRGLKGTQLTVQPGVYIRDIDPLLAEKDLMLGCIPASRAICTIGGMVGNNAGGEQSLRYGNTERSVRKMQVILADGNEYTLEPMTKKQLDLKMKQDTYEGRLHKEVYDLIEAHYDRIKNARPHVNKNSMGYNLWSVWDRHTGIFDLTRLFSGSQGTLGLISNITMQAVPKAKHTGLLLAYLESPKKLGDIIPAVMKHNPATFEGFDDITFSLGVKYNSMFRKQLGAKEWLREQKWLLRTVSKFKNHYPNIVLMIEFEGESQDEVDAKINALYKDLSVFKLKMDVEHTATESAPFWVIRRASLALLRNRVKDKYASPFIDDMTVQPKYLPEFLPKVRKVIQKYNLPATLAGHFGDGNFHIIPLMDIENPKDQAKLEPVMRELIPIVLQYQGTMAGEHNDGLVRGPWLPAVFGDEMYEIFKHVKEIFDPQYIFNPHKKTDASWDYSMDHIRTRNSNGLIK